MSESDAFEAARRLIAEAKATGEKDLSFDRVETRALSSLPEEIGGLDRLRALHLNHTQVSDLAPLTGLTGLAWLGLYYAPLNDLAPLAGMSGLTRLLLGGTQVDDLAPLAGLTGLTRLGLYNTQVEDLAPLAGMTKLKELDLHNTQVRDLAPLSGMTKLKELQLVSVPVTDLRVVATLRLLAERPTDLGLTFKNCGAARVDPRIAEIAEIKDPGERARTLFAYLEGWEPPSGSTNEPEPDPLFPVHVEDDRLEIAASLPTEAERDERLKRVLHERLREKSNDLAQAAGNRFPRLAARARAVALQADRPFEEVDLLLLHLDVQDLASRQDAGAEDGAAFPPEVTGPIADLLRFAPGLTLGHPDVDLLNARIDLARRNPPSVDEASAHDALSRAVAGDDQAIGDRLRALEQRTVGQPQPIAIAVQRPAHRNILWRVAVVSAVYGVAPFSVNLASDVLGPPVIAFVTSNWPLLLDVAATYGSAFLDGFLASVAPHPELANLARHAAQRPKGRQRSQV